MSEHAIDCDCAECQENCMHDWDVQKGCLNCGKEFDMGGYIDYLHDRMEDR